MLFLIKPLLTIYDNYKGAINIYAIWTWYQCCPKRFSIKTKKGSKAKVEITTLAKSTTSFTSYGKYNTFRTSNR